MTAWQIMPETLSETVLEIVPNIVHEIHLEIPWNCKKAGAWNCQWKDNFSLN